MAVEIHNPKIPRRFKINDSLIEEFLIDPVAAAYCIFGVKLDAFQRVRLRKYWWIPEVIDSSGVSTGKTLVFWIYSNLRAILIGKHTVGVFYQTFSTGKEAFWNQYTKPWGQHPVFRAQLGRFDELGREAKSTQKSPSCYSFGFNNGSRVLMPAPSWLRDAQNLGSYRFNTGGIDEWTKVENTGTTGIDDQFLGRITETNWNQNHPIWCNHFKFLATAESQGHPAWRRYNRFLNRMRKGNPHVDVFSFNYKDYSDEEIEKGRTFKSKFRQENTMNQMKDQLERDHVMREVYGIWSKSGRGWYSAEAIDRAIELGRQLGFEVEHNVGLRN